MRSSLQEEQRAFRWDIGNVASDRFRAEAVVIPMLQAIRYECGSYSSGNSRPSSQVPGKTNGHGERAQHAAIMPQLPKRATLKARIEFLRTTGERRLGAKSNRHLRFTNTR